MIETTYVRLAQAAAMLDTDADTLLIAAAEGRIRAFWLLNALVEAECGRYEETDGGPDEPPDMWVPCDENPFYYVMCALLERDEAAELLKRPEIVARAVWLSKPDAERNQWRPFGGWGNDKNISESERRVTQDYVFFECADIEAIKAAHATPAPDTIKNAPMPDRSHISDWLALLNQAARRWWANAVRHDPATHPSNAAVAAWLIEKGMTKSLAERAASIIRPEWAHTGRKPDA